MLIPALLLLAGLVILYFGAEGFVNGASALALRMGIAPLVVGLTVVAFGTSAPELLVSLLASLEGAGGIAIGNIVGSNVANLLLILGAAALVRPLTVHAQVVNREMPFMVGASVLFIILGRDGLLTRYDGLALLLGMGIYLAVTYVMARREMRAVEEAFHASGEQQEASEEEVLPRWKAIVMLVLGLAGLVIGAKFMVDSAITIAKILQVPDLVIGISIVAVGTSLPELATSIVAAYRNQSDIAVGNAVGSNIFNILLVLGLVAIVTNQTISSDVRNIDLWVMLGTAVGIWPLLRHGFTLDRWKGAILLMVYAGYMVSLFRRTAGIEAY